MTKDLNKGISNISYNLLNLPQQVDILSRLAEARNAYSYSADGEKLRVVKKYNSNFNTSPIIGSAVNVSSMDVTKTTDYVDGKLFENNVLDRIFVDGGYIKGSVYYFYETDHLGSNRLTVSQTGAASDRSDYFPYGMQMAHNDPDKGMAMARDDGSAKTSFKFSGKELDVMHGLNLYDFSARSHDPTLGRFTTVDPLAEKYYSWSPYAYCLNNPVKYVDPKGEDVYLITWASHDREVGHAGIAVDNYKTEVVKDKKGNAVLDKNGNPVTQQVKDGTVTYYDLWPGESVSKGNFDENVSGGYKSKVTTLSDLKNTDVSGGEKRSPDGVVQLNTNASTDELVNISLSAHKDANPMYNGMTNNCSDYARSGIEYAAPIGSPLGNTREQIDNWKVTTPNYLYNATIRLPNATIIKNPGNKANTSFIDAMGNNKVRRKIVNKKL